MEGFRILEITQPSEIHVTANQLTVEQVIEPKKKRKVCCTNITHNRKTVLQDGTLPVRTRFSRRNCRNK